MAQEAGVLRKQAMLGRCLPTTCGPGAGRSHVVLMPWERLGTSYSPLP
ncbi:hypothetical protein KCP78_21005 [Salmonella enterica subsp. enterica]|nr:hypothetical protein KCP78_21005 [Salmonella enterica subsp. enterica]